MGTSLVGEKMEMGRALSVSPRGERKSCASDGSGHELVPSSHASGNGKIDTESLGTTDQEEGWLVGWTSELLR